MRTRAIRRGIGPATSTSARSTRLDYFLSLVISPESARHAVMSVNACLRLCIPQIPSATNALEISGVQEGNWCLG
ncbi:MAG: hypothetical protein WBL63_26210, partial [Candidatus Acidiferrum sp.]